MQPRNAWKAYLIAGILPLVHTGTYKVELRNA